MKKTILRIIDVLECINQKNKLKIKNKEFDEERYDPYDSENTNKTDKNLQEAYDVIKSSTQNGSIKNLIKGAFNFSIGIDSLSSDLLNIEQLMTKMMRKISSNQNTQQYNAKIRLNFPETIKYLLSHNLILQKDDGLKDKLYKNIYRLNKTFSPALRKNDCILFKNKLYLLYDESFHLFKLAFNEDGSCNILETKKILDKIPLQDEKLFG